MDRLLLYVGLLLSIALPIVVYWAIPTYVSDDQQEEIKDIVLVSYSGILFFMNVLSIDYYSTGISAIVILLFTFVILGIVASGIFWWIPTYIPANQQKLAKQWLIICATISTVVFSFINKELMEANTEAKRIIQELPSFSKYGGKRRK